MQVGPRTSEVAYAIGEDAHDHSGERVRQSKPEARQDEPYEVQNRAHMVSLALGKPTRLGVPSGPSYIETPRDPDPDEPKSAEEVEIPKPSRRRKRAGGGPEAVSFP